MPTPLDTASLALLPANLAEIFQEVQTSTVNHRKNCFKLFKLHAGAQATLEQTRSGGTKFTGGNVFEEAFVKCLCACLLQDDQEREPCIKLVVQFTGAYFEFVNDRACKEYDSQVEQGHIDETIQESIEMGRGHIPGFFFTAYILRRFILKGLEASGEPIRHRVLHFFSTMVPYLGRPRPDLCDDLKNALISQLRLPNSETKPRSRLFIVSCLAHLSDATEGGDSSIQDVLLKVLHPGEPRQVLKVAMSSVCPMPDIMPLLLKLSRHQDRHVRKLVYGVFANHLEKTDEEGGTHLGPTHPSRLPLGTVEILIKNGLTDREDVVRQAALSLVNSWITVAEQAHGHRAAGSSSSVEDGVVALLRMFNVHKRDSLPTRVVEILIERILGARRDGLQHITFEGRDWGCVEVEEAIFSRVLFDFLGNTDEEWLNDTLPNPANLADGIKSRLQMLVDAYSVDGDSSAGRDDSHRKEMSLRELLNIAVKLDYQDSQYGREQMVLVVNDVLREHRLPGEILPFCIDTLFAAESDKGGTDVVLAIAAVVRALLHEASQTPGDEVLLDRVHGWCLRMCIHMLENINKVGHPGYREPIANTLSADLLSPHRLAGSSSRL
ncbi:hypothetical protein NMY22_g16062 [Coprinellus aureogranulatus]|nr:hypothetical protein NMY22_g16062 [Coprinellus aureogranulatus]